MINLDKKNSNDRPVTFSNIIWKSSILAMIFTLPALGIFLGIYYSTGDLLVGAIPGFGAYFATQHFQGGFQNGL